MKSSFILTVCLVSTLFVSGCSSPAPQTSSVPAPLVGPVVPDGAAEIHDLTTTTETVPNCSGGNSTIIKHPSMTILTSHAVEWEVGGQIGVGVHIGDGVVPGGVDLSGALETHLSHTSENSFRQSMGWDLPAEPNSIMEYTLMWREIWQPGYIDVILADQRVMRVYVRYRTGIQSDIIGQRKLDCASGQSIATQVIVIVPTATQQGPSSQDVSVQDLNAILGAGRWHCVDGFPHAVSIDNVPSNFVVQLPFTRVDKNDIFYYPGDSVPIGGYATGWLQSIVPKSDCSPIQPDITQTDINALFGNGNWYCLTQYPTGVKVRSFPENYTVASPVIFVDKNDVRYYKGDTVPSGGPATVWFPNEIPTSECP